MSQNAVKDFIAHAEAFIGLYEPVYLIREGLMKQCRGVWADWDVRIHNLNSAESLIRFWDDEFSDCSGWNDKVYEKKAQALLRFLGKAGVMRSDEKEIYISQETYRYYAAEDGNLIESGTAVFVKQPFWSLNGNVLEKGIIISQH